MRIHRILAISLFLLLLVSLAAPPLAAQQTQKKSEIEFLPVERKVDEPNREWEYYQVFFNVEIGGQMSDVTGNQLVYNSQQNYQDGLRVFQFALGGEGQGDAWFSRFRVEGGGWGNNEPYSWGKFNFTRDNVFDLSGNVRQSRYDWFFPGFTRNQHFNQTERRMQNYNLKLFPRRNFRVNAGYSRNSNYGPSYTTLDFSRGEFPLIEPIRQTYDEYRIGADGNLDRWFYSFEYGYRYFRNDRFLTLTEFPSAPNDPADFASFNDFFRVHPSTSEIPFYRANIAGRPHDTVEVSARMVYSSAESNFTRRDFLDGTTYRQGGSVPSVPITADYLAAGTATRPMTTADVAATWRPRSFITVTNTFQYHGYDIAGFDEENRDITCGAVSASCDDGLFDLTWDTFLDLDSFTNRTEALVELGAGVGVRGGFRYQKRDYRFVGTHLVVDNGVPGTLDVHGEDFDFTNTAILAGSSFKLHRRASVFFDMEMGDNTRVFTRMGPAKLDRYRWRGRFEPWDGVRISGSFFHFDNENPNLPIPNPLFPGTTRPGRYDTQNRGYAADFQYSTTDRGYINAGYSRNDINTKADVVYYFGGLQAGESLYTLDDNYFYIDGGAHLGQGFYLDGGYRLVDTSAAFPPSDPLAGCVPIVSGQCDNTGALGPLEYFDGGLKYHQPHLSFRYVVNDNVSWKAGWRYYKYDQLGGTFSDYKAHMVTASMVLHF